MRLYVLLSDPVNDNLEKAIKGEFPDRYFDFGDGQWFVAGQGTAAHIYEKLSENEDAYGDIGSVVVLSILGHHGYASTNLWDWMIGMSE